MVSVFNSNFRKKEETTDAVKKIEEPHQTFTVAIVHV